MYYSSIEGLLMTAKKTVIRENIEWTNMRWNNAPDTDKPRVLLIGDSIVVGHADKAHDLLKDKVCVDYYATAKCVSDVDYMFELDYMLTRYDYALVVFNNGLHGWDIDDAIYSENLQETLTVMKQKVNKLAWRTSTPIREKGNLEQPEAERTPRLLIRNADAAKIAEELDLPILDLYTPMDNAPELFSEDAIHYTEEGRDVQAAKVAEFISKQLAL
jgi:hypothetical protein